MTSWKLTPKFSFVSNLLNYTAGFELSIRLIFEVFQLSVIEFIGLRCIQILK